jgi:hypothetical protein
MNIDFSEFFNWIKTYYSVMLVYLSRLIVYLRTLSHIYSSIIKYEYIRESTRVFNIITQYKFILVYIGRLANNDELVVMFGSIDPVLKPRYDNSAG